MKKFIILILLLSTTQVGTFSNANSGPTYLEGYPSSEILVVEENGQDLDFEVFI